MLDCDTLESSLSRFKGCKPTNEGLRIAADCLLPSFEQLHVYVVRFGDGYIVHDDCAAARSAWGHGVDAATTAKDVSAVARTFSCKSENNQISIVVPSSEWIWSAVASVANASAEAARRSVSKARKLAAPSLYAQTRIAIERGTPDARLVTEFSFSGSSGRHYQFDFGVLRGESTALIDIVSPHPTSIAFKHLAFSDVAIGPSDEKYIVYAGDLTQSDKVLLSNVADLIALTETRVKEGWNVFH